MLDKINMNYYPIGQCIKKWMEKYAMECSFNKES